MQNTVFYAIDNGMMIEVISRDYEFDMPYKHFHNEYEIYYLLSGERYYFIDNQTYYVKKGSIVLVDSNQIHQTSTVNKPFHERLLVNIRETVFEKYKPIFGALNLPDFFKRNFGVFQLNEEEQAYVESILFSMIEEVKNKKTEYEFLLLIKLTELLIFLIRKQQELSKVNQPISIQSAKHRKIQEVANYISNHYASCGSLDELAKRFFVSKYYLCRIFKEVTGFTVNEYISINRIKQAQILLERSNLSITEIAEKVGYYNITHFEKVFKTYLGTTPLKYRKSLK
ncbi:MAG: AraC family transcriptional regulator [Epulopiscium sp.]|nr:AraC family transcriptional regulator [Candidatus Epulonipiscium sp.]